MGTGIRLFRAGKIGFHSLGLGFCKMSYSNSKRLGLILHEWASDFAVKFWVGKQDYGTSSKEFLNNKEELEMLGNAAFLKIKTIQVLYISSTHKFSRMDLGCYVP